MRVRPFTAISPLSPGPSASPVSGSTIRTDHAGQRATVGRAPLLGRRRCRQGRADREGLRRPVARVGAVLVLLEPDESGKGRGELDLSRAGEVARSPRRGALPSPFPDGATRVRRSRPRLRHRTSAAPGSNTSSVSSNDPAARLAPSDMQIPAVQKNGKAVKSRSSGVSPINSANRKLWMMGARWRWSTPLGSEVVPDV